MRIDQNKLNSNVDVVLTIVMNCIVVGMIFIFILLVILVFYLIISMIVHPPLSHEKKNEATPIEWSVVESPSPEYNCFIREGYYQVYCFPLVTKDEEDQDIYK